MNLPMKTSARILLALAAYLVTLAWPPVHAIADPYDVICCGADEVFLISEGSPEIKKWSWRVEQSPTIPPALRQRFRTTDDCKPYEQGLLLITSSGGGVALIDRETKRCQFLALSTNAHSACLLPDQQIVVASSFGGDQVQFFDRNEQQKPATVVQSVALLGAHGTVWDPNRKCLWALGEKELVSLSADPKATPQSRWSVQSRTPLPSNGGHDLSPLHDGERLFVTTDTQVLTFHCDKHSFSVADELPDQARIKSVDRNRETGRIVYHQASTENWWSDVIRFAGGTMLTLSDERLYKVRWDTPSTLP